MARRPRPAERPLVSLVEASVALGGRTVLDRITLSLRPGARLGLLGANGSGKSTLLRVLRGDQWLDPAAPGLRRYALSGPPTGSPIGARERLALCAPEEQDAYARRDLDLPVEAVIRSGLDGTLYPVEGPTPARTARVRAAAAAMGIGALLARSFLTLSRGEGRKVLVARALAARPAALLLDEVCDGLDAAARHALLRRLAAVAARGTAVVTAVHRAEELFPGVDEVVSAWRAAFPPAAPRRRPGPAARPAHPRRTAGPARSATAVAFDLRRVTVLVEGTATLRQVTWRVGAGEAWAVTGPNGAGKSTLLRLLAGEVQPASGEIRRLDLGRRADAGALRLRIGQVSPELQARHRFDASGEALVCSGFQGTVGLDRAPTAAERSSARALLERLGLLRLARRRILTCSYGELRLLLLARALAPGPEVLLLDEPFAGLDPGARAALGAAVAAVVAHGTGLVLVTHHEDEVPASVSRRARLEDGRLTVALSSR